MLFVCSVIYFALIGYFRRQLRRREQQVEEFGPVTENILEKKKVDSVASRARICLRYYSD